MSLLAQLNLDAMVLYKIGQIQTENTLYCKMSSHYCPGEKVYATTEGKREGLHVIRSLEDKAEKCW